MDANDQLIDVPIWTRAQMMAAGHSDLALRRRLASDGDLVALAHGLYVDGRTWRAADEVGRHVLLVRAAVLSSDAVSAVSHGSAAVCQGLATLRSSRRTVHLTRPGLPRSRKRAGHVLHGGRLDPEELHLVGGLLVTSAARTAADIARTDGWLAGLVVTDQVLRSGTSREELIDGFARLAGRKGAGVLPRLVKLADPGAENPGESLARALVLEVTEALGLAPPITQVEFRDGARTAYVDLRVGNVLIEFDGRVKYTRDRPFGDASSIEDVLWAEKLREDWLRSMGFVIVRLTWPDVWGSGRAAATARLHRVLREHGHP